MGDLHISVQNNGPIQTFDDVSSDATTVFILDKEKDGVRVSQGIVDPKFQSLCAVDSSSGLGQLVAVRYLGGAPGMVYGPIVCKLEDELQVPTPPVCP